mgnify:CR=1 FL=1
MITAVLDIEGFEEPVIGQLVSIPERAEPRVNRLALREGRLAGAGWDGFLHARKFGTYKIHEIIRTGAMKMESSVLLR